MTAQPPPPGSPFFFASKYGLIICIEHGSAVFVDSVRSHLSDSHLHIRGICKHVDWARDLPNAIRNRREYFARQPWKLRSPESLPLPYLRTHIGGFKCRYPQCGQVYPRAQESRIRKHCLDVHHRTSRPGSLPYDQDVCYQTFNSAFVDKDGYSYAFGVKPTRATSRQPKLSPDAAEWELSEAMGSIGHDRPSRRTATKAESSSQKDGAPQSQPVGHSRLRHVSIDSDEPLCFQGRIKLSRAYRKSRKQKRAEPPTKHEESNDSDDSDDSGGCDDGVSTSDDEASTYGSASVSLGEPRQHTNDESVERLGRLQQSYAEEPSALRHELRLKSGEIAQLQEQLHGRTGELEKLVAEEVITKDEYKMAKKNLLVAKKQHKAKEKEWASQNNDTSRNTLCLQNELEENSKRMRKYERDLEIQRKDIVNFRKQVQELRKSNQELQGALDERGEEIRTLHSQLKSREASAVAKSLEQANAALKEAQELNDSYATRISELDQECARKGEVIIERVSEVFATTAKIDALEEELQRERARCPEERRANEDQLGHEREELQEGCSSTTTESEGRWRTPSLMGEEAFATESGRRSVEDLTTQLQVAKDLRVKAEEKAAKNKKKAAKRGEKVKELQNRLREKEEQLAHIDQGVLWLARSAKRRSTPKHKTRSKRVKRETTALPSPPPSSQREVVDLTQE